MKYANKTCKIQKKVVILRLNSKITNKFLFVMIVETSPYKVFALSQGGELAKRVCEYLGCSLGNIQVARFSDGEFAVSFEESVRGQSV